MAHDKLRAQIKAVLKRDTEVFAQLLENPIGSKLSEKAKAVAEVLKTKDFGGSSEPLRLLMSLILGEELPAAKDGSTLYVNIGFIALMATSKNVEECEYHTGQVVAKLPGFEFTYNDQFVKQSGRIGAHFTSNKEEFRPATVKEIDSYVDTLTDDVMAYMVKRVVVLEAEPVGMTPRRLYD